MLWTISITLSAVSVILSGISLWHDHTTRQRLSKDEAKFRTHMTREHHIEEAS